MTQATPEIDDYRPLNIRRRLLIALLAVVTAITIVLMLLYPPGGPDRSKRAPSGPQPCSGGATRDCIGGQSDVILPAAHTASGT